MKKGLKFFISFILTAFLLVSIPLLTAGCVGCGVNGLLSVDKLEVTAVVGAQELYLPNFKATSANGEDISALVEILDDKQSVIDRAKGTIVLKEDGVHTLTYRVVDPATGKTISHSFTVRRYREIFDFYALDGVLSQYAENAEQYVTSVHAEQGISRFNLPASKMYYAEVYFNATTATAFLAGLAHVESVSENGSANSWFASLVDVSDGMKNKFFTDVGWVMSEINGAGSETGLTVGAGFKYAIARNRDDFYAFVNDKLVGRYINKELAYTPTVPGIFTVAISGGDFVSAGGVKISAIDYYSGPQAKEKIEALTGEKIDFDIEIDVGDMGWGEYDSPLD